MIPDQVRDPSAPELPPPPTPAAPTVGPGVALPMEIDHQPGFGTTFGPDAQPSIGPQDQLRNAYTTFYALLPALGSESTILKAGSAVRICGPTSAPNGDPTLGAATTTLQIALDDSTEWITVDFGVWAASQGFTSGICSEFVLSGVQFSKIRYRCFSNPGVRCEFNIFANPVNIQRF